MATLRTPLKFMDAIMNKLTQKEFYYVLKETLHNVWIIDLEGKEEPKELPKRIINLSFIKVDPKTAKILYGESDVKKVDDNTNSEPKL